MSTGAPSSPASSRAVWGALSFMYLVRLGSAWLLSLPILNAVRASGIGAFPEGDTKLLEAGGLYLVEWLRHEQAHLRASLPSSAYLLALLSFAAVVPEWLLLEALARGRGAWTREGALGRLARLALLGLATWVLRALVWVILMVIAMQGRAWFGGAADARFGDGVLAVAILLGLALQLGISLSQDLLRGHVVAGPASSLARAAARALPSFRRHAGRLSGLYAAYRGSTAVLLLGSTWLVSQLDAALPGTHDAADNRWVAALACLVHQTGLGLTLLARMLWLAQAVRHATGAPRGPARLADAAPSA